MPGIAIGTIGASNTAENLVLSVRDQIPDPVTAATDDGNAFSLNTLIRWINDAMRIMASSAPIVQDWYAVRAVDDQDIYELPSIILSVEQLWYDLNPCTRSPEGDSIWESKVNSRSYYFGPHAIHSTPRIHVWPAPDRSGLSTTLNGALTSTATSATLTATTNMEAFGFIMVESELIAYRTLNTTTNVVSNCLRGQGGTTAAAHNDASTVTEQNIMFKCSRLPTPLTTATSIIEIPVGLVPVLELYVLSKVREAEQDHQTALANRQAFDAAVQTLANNAAFRGLRQGIQVREAAPGPALYYGRLFVP